MNIFVNYAEEDWSLGSLLTESLASENKIAGWRIIDRNSGREENHLVQNQEHQDVIIVLWTKNARLSSAIRADAEKAIARNALVNVVTDHGSVPDKFCTTLTIRLSVAAKDESPILDLLEALDQKALEQGLSKAPFVRRADHLSTSTKKLAQQLKSDGFRTSPPFDFDSVENRFQFDGWIVNPNGNELIMGKERTRVSPKAMAVLVYLANHAGDTVSKESLLDAVWGNTVVGDNAIHQCIKELRRALLDSTHDPLYIETIARKGYRLISKVNFREET